METTIEIDEAVAERLKAEAARQGCTVSEVIQAALRTFLPAQDSAESMDIPSLPTFRGGRELVDIADRDALYRAMEGR